MGDPLHFVLQLRLAADEIFFGPGVARVLHLVDELHSLNAAAAAMSMSYSKAWKMIRSMEQQLGIKVIDRRVGGKEGGGSSLTLEGRLFLESYARFEADMKRYGGDAFQRIFANFTAGQKRTVYLVRHGLPDFRGGGSMCLGLTDVPLCEEGRRQARRAGAYLQKLNKKPHVFSSPLSRSVETAGLLGFGEPELLEGMRELGAGEWDGLYFYEIKLRYAELYARRASDPTLQPPGAEPLAGGQARALAGLAAALTGCDGDLVIVAHAGVNRLLLSALLGKPLAAWMEIPQPYGCINILRMNGPTCTVEQVGLVPEED